MIGWRSRGQLKLAVDEDERGSQGRGESSNRDSGGEGRT